MLEYDAVRHSAWRRVFGVERDTEILDSNDESFKEGCKWMLGIDQEIMKLFIVCETRLTNGIIIEQMCQKKETHGEQNKGK